MGIRRKKLLVIGIDQAIPYLLNKFIKEGVIPNIAKLAESGVMGEAFPCAPCDTPTNWATIATGANTAIHGVTSFYMHLPGEALDLGLKYRSRTQLSKYCNAEYIWDVIDKSGLTPFVFNYPAGWPAHFKKGVMSLFTWTIPESLPRMLLRSSIYTFNKHAENNKNCIIKAKSIESVIKSNLAILYSSLLIRSNEIEEQNLIKLYIVSQGENKYNAVKIPTYLSNGYTTIKENEWSNWIKRDVNTIYGVLPCLFKLKVVNLDPSGTFLKVQRSALFNTIGWTSPETFGNKLVKNVFKYDLPQRRKVEFMIYGKLNHFLSSAREESQTLTDVIKFAYRDLNWDVCFFHYHPLDTLNHDSLAYLNKNSPVFNEKKKDKNWNSCTDENTIIMFVSDHGAIPVWKSVNIPLVFKKAGLTYYKWNNSFKRYLIDWEKTLAFPYMEPPFVWINLKHRDPQGIVSEADYENIRDKVIETLSSIKDPQTNDSVIEKVLRKEDATYLGLNSDRVGDLIYFLKPPYSIFDGNLDSLDSSSFSRNQLSELEVNDSKTFFGAHAYYLPSTRFNNYSISAPFIISGPGIKEGFELKNSINLTDVTPTLANLLEIPKPANSQGKVLYDFFK
jgi:predicted AlkP superfamily phosphohydrolase/phosphomutase